MKIFNVLFSISFFILQIVFCHGQIQQKGDSLKERNIVIVLDNSGSMKKNDPNYLTKTVVKNFINKIDNKTYIALLLFDKDTKLLLPLTLMKDTSIKTETEKKLDTLSYNGNYTNIPVAIERAIYELKIHGNINSFRSIILLTDGYIDTGDKGKDSEKLEWLKNSLTQEAKKENIQIFGIAFTENADFQLMQVLAQKTGGDYFRAISPGDIEPVFNKIYEKFIISEKIPEGQTVQEKPSTTENINYLLILGALIVVIVGIVAIVLTIRSKSARQQVIVQKAVIGDITEEGPVPPAKLVQTVDKKEHTINKANFSIGRKDGNDLCIKADTISGTHAFIKYRNNKFFLSDNHSTNSTFLNGKRINPGTDIMLNNNDEIKFDLYLYTFILPKEEESGKTILRKENNQEEGSTVYRKKEEKPEELKKEQKNKVEENDVVKQVEQKEIINEKDSPNSKPQSSEPANTIKKPDNKVSGKELKQAKCPNHVSYNATQLCPICKIQYCKLCMVEKGGKMICKSCAD